MTYTCDSCHQTVSLDGGFFRSVNLRTVAWCRDCWFAKHADLRVPQQRQAEETSSRRWLPRR
jgi:hypothetical protein